MTLCWLLTVLLFFGLLYLLRAGLILLVATVIYLAKEVR